MGGDLGWELCPHRNIERGESAVRVAHEAVIHITRVSETPVNRSCRVDAGSSGALAGICARAWGIEGGDGAVGSPHEAVRHEACVKVDSHDKPCRVDATVLTHKGA